ncbi:MAG: hypothetical protein IPH69_16785 [Bacteroidales bacterium]|nr:hypothetical protein [Bacteroidales bacterium]
MKRPLMIRFYKSGLALLLMLLIFRSMSAQTDADIKGTITAKFLKYCKELPRQEIFVHTDRQSFIAGEDIWFSIYLFDRKTNKPQVQEKIAYIEILNAENRPVAQKRIIMENGTGPGQISLPDTLSSGTYTLRAYTNWMKNFMPVNCYMEELTIYNSFRNQAFIYKSYRDTESSVNKITVPGADGLQLEVNNLMPENVELVITTSDRYRAENRNTFFLFIQTRGKIDHFATEKALTQKTVLTFPKSLLTAGINQITIFDAAGQVMKERLIYTPEPPVNSITFSSSSQVKTREKINAVLELSPDLVKELQWANMSVSVIPEQSEKNKIEMSDYMVFASEFGIKPLTLLQKKSLSELSDLQIDSLLLTVSSNWIDWDKILSDEVSIMRYKPETEYHYLSGRLIKKNSSPSDSGKYVYMSVPGKVARFQYAKTDDESGFSMKVRIDDRVKDFVIQPGDPENIASTKIESSFSEKYMPSVPFYSEKDVAVPSSEISRMSTNYQVNKIYSTTLLGPPLSQASVAEIKPKRFYGKPDISLVMDDYIKLPVMEEVFFELIPGATLRKKKTGYEISVFDPSDNKVYNFPPCLMIDGTIIYNPSFIADIDPELVERIDLVKDKYFVGDNQFYGIINIITRTGDFSSVTLPEYATRMQYKVYEPCFTFTAPDYTAFDKQLSRVPDFRNTLYWNPAVKTDKSGKASIDFWTCDIKSNYVICIQGVTSDGRIISYKSGIRVD